MELNWVPNLSCYYVTTQHVPFWVFDLSKLLLSEVQQFVRRLLHIGEYYYTKLAVLKLKATKGK